MAEFTTLIKSGKIQAAYLTRQAILERNKSKCTFDQRVRSRKSQ